MIRITTKLDNIQVKNPDGTEVNIMFWEDIKTGQLAKVSISKYNPNIEGENREIRSGQVILED